VSGADAFDYDFDVDRIVRFIKDTGARKILMQLADGLKQYSVRLSEIIEERTGCTCIVSADPCYGFCDVAEDEADRLDVDAIVHIGHSSPRTQFRKPVLFIEAYSRLDVSRVIRKSVEALKKHGYTKVGLCASVQHLRELPKAEEILRKSGVEVYVGEDPSGMLSRGQVIGCNVSTALSVKDLVDCFIVVSGGNFHGLGVALYTGVRVFVADPYREEVRDLSGLVRRTLAVRWYAISKLRDAGRVGIVVGLKTGQAFMEQALKLKKRLEEKSKKVYLFALREVVPEALVAFKDIEVFVIAACPRIPIDDYSSFHVPVLNVREAYMCLENYMGKYYDFK